MLFDADKLKRTFDLHFRTSKIFHSNLRYTVIETENFGNPIKYRIKYYYVNRDVMNINDAMSIMNGTLKGFTKKVFILKRAISIRKKL